MGTDINGFAEWKFSNVDDNPGAWSLIAPVPSLRSYRVFELLANVRESGELVRTFADMIPLRGLPHYYHSIEQPHGIDLGDHHYTWYMLDEIARADMWNQVEHDLPRELWRSFLSYLGWFRQSWHGCDVRIVIGFDS